MTVTLAVYAIRCLALPGPPGTQAKAKPKWEDEKQLETTPGSCDLRSFGRDRCPDQGPCSTSRRPKTKSSPRRKAQSEF